MVNLLPTIRLAQSMLKRKFSSVNKPLRIYRPLQRQAPQKGPLKNISTTAYFGNFTVTPKKFLIRDREKECQILQNYILHMKFSEFHLCNHNFCEI